MSAWLLVPGRGGRYTTEAFTTAGVGADTLDCTRCTGLSAQQTLVGAASLGGTYQLEETIDGTNFVAFGPAVTVLDNGIQKYEAAVRPFSKIRVNTAGVTGLDATHTFQLTLQGAAIGSGLF